MSSGSATASSLEGTLLGGRYRLRYKIAQGGMAAVYLAQLEGSHGFERWVAVKVVHPHLSEERRFATMLLDEARVAARLHHPNVCAVLDFGEQGNLLYLAMEYLQAESLSSAMRRGWRNAGEFPAWLAARVITDAARGLHAAHELTDAAEEPLHVVHRDVSPQNILILYDGHAKVVDFGIARARGRLTSTDAGEMKGKFAYMSPEQLRQDDTVDRRTDVWGLGVCLWESSVGKRLFRADSHGRTVANVLDAKVPRPTEIIADYPPRLEAAVMRALERDIEKRTPTAGELAEEIEGYLYSMGRPVGPTQAGRWMKEHFADKLQTRRAMLRSAVGVDSIQEVDLQSESTIGSQVRATGRSDPDISDPDIEELEAAKTEIGFEMPIEPTVADASLPAAPTTDEVAVDIPVTVPTAVPSAFDPPTVPPVTRPVQATASRIPKLVLIGGSVIAALLAVVLVVVLTGDGEDVTPELVAVPAEVVEPTNVPLPPTTDEEIDEPETVEPEVVEPELVETDPEQTTDQSEEPQERERTSMRASSDRPRQPVGTGTLNLLAIPQADVFRGSRRLGRTPLVGIELPAGTHRLRLEPVGGGPSKRVSVVIRPDERTSRSIRL